MSVQPRSASEPRLAPASFVVAFVVALVLASALPAAAGPPPRVLVDGAALQGSNGIAVGPDGHPPFPGLPPSWLFNGVAVGSRGDAYVGGNVANVIYQVRVE